MSDHDTLIWDAVAHYRAEWENLFAAVDQASAIYAQAMAAMAKHFQPSPLAAQAMRNLGLEWPPPSLEWKLQPWPRDEPLRVRPPRRVARRVHRRKLKRR